MCSDWPQIHYVTKDDHETPDLPASAPVTEILDTMPHWFIQGSGLKADFMHAKQELYLLTE